MKRNAFLGFLLLSLAVTLAVGGRRQAFAGEPSAADYKVLAPIRHGNLTVFPVITATSHDTGEFLTLDEGLKSGEVEVTESGSVRGMVRRPPRGSHGVLRPEYQEQAGAQVNKLMLVNNSKRPLLLLAGEIVTGGKQDRVIAKDRIVPAESDPIDLDVFCVEPGRWVGTSGKFVSGMVGAGMAAPSVRSKAMADKDQQQVWAEVAKARTQMSQSLEVEAPRAARELSGTTSYAKVMQNEEVSRKVDSVAGSVEKEYASTIQQLRDRHAVGVVVAVNGKFVWADILRAPACSRSIGPSWCARMQPKPS
jgi:hypothetical protein